MALKLRPFTGKKRQIVTLTEWDDQPVVQMVRVKRKKFDSAIDLPGTQVLSLVWCDFHEGAILGVAILTDGHGWWRAEGHAGRVSDDCGDVDLSPCDQVILNEAIRKHLGGGV